MRVLLLFLSLLPVLANAVPATSSGNLPWEKTDEEEGITLYRREIPGSDVIAFKGEGAIDAPILRVASVILDHPRLHEWVNDIEESRVFKPLGPGEFLEYTHFGTPFIVKDRDFVVHVKYDVDPDGAIHFDYKSTEDEAAPKTDYVRGNLITSRFDLRPADDGKRTRFVGEICADPMGSIPKWLANFFQKKWPRDTLKNLQRQVAKKDIVESAEITAALAKASATTRASAPAVRELSSEAAPAQRSHASHP